MVNSNAKVDSNANRRGTRSPTDERSTGNP